MVWYGWQQSRSTGGELSSKGRVLEIHEVLWTALQGFPGFLCSVPVAIKYECLQPICNGIATEVIHRAKNSTK